MINLPSFPRIGNFQCYNWDSSGQTRMNWSSDVDTQALHDGLCIGIQEED